MSEEVVVLGIFNNEIDAGMAQQVLEEAGVRTGTPRGDPAPLYSKMTLEEWSLIFSEQQVFVW